MFDLSEKQTFPDLWGKALEEGVQGGKEKKMSFI